MLGAGVPCLNGELGQEVTLPTRLKSSFYGQRTIS